MFLPGNLKIFLFFLVVIVIPAYFINRWMLRVTKPKHSTLGFLMYLGLSLLIGTVYTALFCIIIMLVFPMR